MQKLYPLKDVDRKKFYTLFGNYYDELDCGEDVEHLLDEYVVADYIAGLINVDLLDDGEDTVGFIIYQIDSIENEWNFKEGWGDIREIYLSPSSRGKGYGKFMLLAAEMKLRERGAKSIYTLPFEGALSFFNACGYADCGEYCQELDCPVLVKDKFDNCCKC